MYCTVRMRNRVSNERRPLKMLMYSSVLARTKRDKNEVQDLGRGTCQPLYSGM